MKAAKEEANTVASSVQKYGHAQLITHLFWISHQMPVSQGFFWRRGGPVIEEILHAATIHTDEDMI